MPVALLRLLLCWCPEARADDEANPPTPDAPAAGPAAQPNPAHRDGGGGGGGGAGGGGGGVGWHALCDLAPSLRPLRPLLLLRAPSAAAVRLLAAELRRALQTLQTLQPHHQDSAPPPLAPPPPAPSPSATGVAAGKSEGGEAVVAGEAEEASRRLLWVGLGCGCTDWARHAAVQLLLGPTAEDEGEVSQAEGEATAVELLCWLALPRAGTRERECGLATARWLREDALPAVRRAAAACDGAPSGPAAPLEALLATSLAHPAGHRGLLLRLLLAAAAVAADPTAWLAATVQLAQAQAPPAGCGSTSHAAAGDEQRQAAELMGWMCCLLEHTSAAQAGDGAVAAAARRRVATAALEQAASLAGVAEGTPHAADALLALRRAHCAARGQASKAALESVARCEAALAAFGNGPKSSVCEPTCAQVTLL